MQRLLTSGIYLLIAILPFQTRYIFKEDLNPFAVTSIYVFDLVLVLVAILWLWHWYHTTSPTVNKPAVYLGTTIAILAIFSCYFAGNREVALHYLLHFFGGLSLMAIIATSSIKLRNVMWILFAQSIVQAVFSILQFTMQSVVADRYLGMAQQLPVDSGVAVVATTAGRFLRSYALMPHPNIAAGVIVLGLVAAFFLNIQRDWEKYLAMVGIGVATLGLALTFSRSGLLAYAVVLIVLVIGRIRHYHLLLTSIGVLLACLVYLFPLFTSRLDTSIYTEQISISERATQVHQAAALLPRYWPQGTGLGQYTLLAAKGATAQPLHFVPGLIFLELGVITTLLWYSLIASGWWQHRSQLLRHPAFYLALVFLLVGCFDHYPFTNVSVFWLWCATIGLLYIPQHKPEMTETPGQY